MAVEHDSCPQHPRERLDLVGRTSERRSVFPVEAPADEDPELLRHATPFSDAKASTG